MFMDSKPCFYKQGFDFIHYKTASLVRTTFLFCRVCQTDSFPISATSTSPNGCCRTAAEREVRLDSYKPEGDKSIEKGPLLLESPASGVST